MARKTQAPHGLVRRQPSQTRARHKVELILEAALRILDREGEDALTTNYIASVAGVSIGTLYQYFADRQAIVDALVQRELEAIRKRVMESLSGPAPSEPGGRIRLVVRAVLDAFGGRTAVQRQLLHGASASGGAMSPDRLRSIVMDLLTSSGIVAHDRRLRKLQQAEAFVMVHAFAGVLRGVLAAPPQVPFRAIEDALVRYLLAFMAK
jgi:AcrR family transcriptional regulator